MSGNLYPCLLPHPETDASVGVDMTSTRVDLASHAAATPEKAGGSDTQRTTDAGGNGKTIPQPASFFTDMCVVGFCVCMCTFVRVCVYVTCTCVCTRVCVCLEMSRARRFGMVKFHDGPNEELMRRLQGLVRLYSTRTLAPWKRYTSEDVPASSVTFYYFFTYT